jgi:hypothetical protein
MQNPKVREQYEKLAAGLSAVQKFAEKQKGNNPRVVFKPSPAQHPHLSNGVGHEIHKITTQLGIPACRACYLMALDMDRNGVEWCKQHRDELIAQIEKRAKDMGWLKWIEAGAKAIALGLPKTPAGMFDLAVERACQHATSSTTSAPSPETASGNAT